MRATSLVLLLVLLAGAAPALAQQQQAPPPWFTAEELQQLGQLQPQIQEAFKFKDYEKGLGLLTQTRDIFQKARQRVENGEVELPANVDRKRVLDSLDQLLANDWYNIACCLSKTGKKTEAVDALGKSIDYGYVDVGHMKLDADLDAIRGEPGYQKLIGALEYNEVYEIRAPEGLAGPAPLLVVLHESRADESRAIEIFGDLAKELGMILAAPRGPVTTEKGSYDWSRTGDDETDAMKKIEFTIGKAKAEHAVDPARIYLVGLGDGGKFAATFALTHPKALDGVVSVNGYWNKYYFADFFPAAKAAGLEIALVHAKPTPGYDRSEDGVKQLEEAGIPAKFFGLTWEGAVPASGDDQAAAESKRQKRRAELLSAVKQALTWMRGN